MHKDLYGKIYCTDGYWRHENGRCMGDLPELRQYDIVAEWRDQPQPQLISAAQSDEKTSIDSICSDPAMTAFIEDRRAALRKALNAPPAFELGRKTVLEIRLEKCPCCIHGQVAHHEAEMLHDCPECKGTGFQEKNQTSP